MGRGKGEWGEGSVYVMLGGVSNAEGLKLGRIPRRMILRTLATVNWGGESKTGEKNQLGYTLIVAEERIYCYFKLSSQGRKPRRACSSCSIDSNGFLERANEAKREYPKSFCQQKSARHKLCTVANTLACLGLALAKQRVLNLT